MSEQVLPFYLVCDESGSMAGNGIEAINSALPDLHAEVSSNPVVSDKTRFCLIGFSDTADVILPLCDLSDIDSMPGVTEKGSTNYGAAFTLLKERITQDIDMLKRDGHRVFRPVVFFLSDGQPTDPGWESTHTALTAEEFPYRPHIVAFGIDGADADTIQAVATFRAFIQSNNITPAKALKEFASSLTKSIVRSGASMGSVGGSMTLQVPDKVEGFDSLPLDSM